MGRAPGSHSARRRPPFCGSDCLCLSLGEVLKSHVASPLRPAGKVSALPQASYLFSSGRCSLLRWPLLATRPMAAATGCDGFPAPRQSFTQALAFSDILQVKFSSSQGKECPRGCCHSGTPVRFSRELHSPRTRISDTSPRLPRFMWR